MSTFTFILLLTLVVLASALISQFSQRISVPLIQIALGVILALFGATTTSSAVDPELFLLLFIAPLLYYEARKADKGALWENKIPIISLAIGLVVMIVLMVGFLTHVIEPSIPLAAALALGAALGPTDPVSVAALSKRTGLTTRQRVLLSGESLINDASGVVSFQFAVAALTTGAFSLVHALQTFMISFFGGIILGVALEALLAYMITKTRDAGLEDATFHVLFSLLSPFVIFLAGEAIHVSGILAVVSAGLMYSVFNREIGPDLSRMHIISSSVWQVLTFALNGVVFVLLGIQLPNAMRHTWEDVSLSNLDLVGLVFAITAILIIVRTLWFLLIDAFIRYRKKQDDQKHLSFEGLKAYTTGTLKEAFAMSLAGPKGAISLSIMMTLPYVVKGSLFEQRDLLIFLASGVILVTLLLATFLLPVLVPSTKEARPEDKDDEILIGILRSVIRDLSNAQTPGNRRATQFVIRQYNERIQRIKSGSNFTETTDDTSMRLQSITWQRERMRQYMDDDCTSTTVCQKAFRRLQVQERVLVAHGRIHRGWAQFLWSFTRLTQSIRRVINDRVSFIHWFKDESSIREIQMQALMYAIERMKTYISTSKGATEDAAQVMVDMQRKLRIMQRENRDMISITDAAVLEDQVDEILTASLRLEFSKIQELLDREEIDPACAKRLRDNVHIMRMQLEEHI